RIALRELPQVGDQTALLIGYSAALLIGDPASIEIDVALIEIVQHARADLLFHQVQGKTVVVLGADGELQHAELGKLILVDEPADRARLEDDFGIDRVVARVLPSSELVFAARGRARLVCLLYSSEQRVIGVRELL